MDRDVFFKTEKLNTGYDKMPVLSDVNIRLYRGEILSIIGPNGAGKTTFIKTVIADLATIGGTVFMDNKDVFKMPANTLAKTVSVVLTQKLKASMMTVLDVVATGRYPYTGKFGILSKEDDKKVLEAVDLAGVNDIKDMDYSKLSDGQKQRVVLARALAQEPEIIVLDEPTSFLDIKYKVEFLTLLKKLARERNLTVIMSLHEVELAAVISDKVACFKNGKLDRYGTVAEIYRKDYLYKLYDIDISKTDEGFSEMLGRIFAYNRE